VQGGCYGFEEGGTGLAEAVDADLGDGEGQCGIAFDLGSVKTRLRWI
jgi:hypothetical protein